MNIKNILFAQIIAISLTSGVNASECVDIKDVNVGWTSYKTMAKIGVSGTFKDVKLTKSKDHSTIKSALVGTNVKINFSNIDAKADIKTNNILKFFAPHLKSQDIEAKIIAVNAKSLDLKVTLNKKTQIIPMNYTLDGGVMLANGVIDARDFAMESALKSLNTNVAGHKNKGWLDIDISFELIYTNRCK